MALILRLLSTVNWIIVIALCLFPVICGERCEFPASWRGRWYQDGMGEVVIGETSISKKGECLERHRDYYLIQNKNEHCHQCLIIMNRHHNIIQYKESYCIGRDSLQSICAQMRVEAVLYTLVREPATPMPCPFQGAYHFTYNNNSGGFCRSPVSYVHQCASTSKYRFSFRHCEYAAYTENKEMEFECLGQWKDGSGMYLYGSFAGAVITNRDDMYRCMMYQMLGTVVYISMSADATCRGLMGPRDGPLVMEFTKDVYGWPDPQCAFPYWLTMMKWRDLSGKHTFTTETSAGKTIYVSYQRHPNSTSHVRTTYNCIRLEEDHNSYVHAITLLSYTLDQCAPTYQCVRISQRQPNVIEVQRGDLVKWDHPECDDSDFTEPERFLLIPMVMAPRECPYSGRFTSPPGAHPRCQVAVTSECKNVGRLEILSTCYNRPVARLECLHHWKEDDKQYLIARKWRHENGVVNCYSFRRLSDSQTLFSTDVSCNHGVENIASEQVSYTLRTETESCRPQNREAGDENVLDEEPYTSVPGQNEDIKKSHAEEKQQYISFNGTDKSQCVSVVFGLISVFLTCAISRAIFMGR